MTIALRGGDGGAVSISPETLAAFQAGFRGKVLTSASPEYDETRKIWNAMIDRRPALIARCTGTADVVQAVRFAREHRLLVSLRGGGHNIAGLALCEGGMMIDLSPMKGVSVDPKARLARAQPGCLLAEVDRETQLHGLAAVLGFISTTGIAGLTTGGGFGYLTRRFGWTCDNVASMEVVTADAKVVRAADDENPELLWALRGGSGNFDVVTSFEYRLFPVGPQVLGGAMAWHAADAKEVLRAFGEVTASSPRELTLVAGLRLAPPAPWLPKEIHGKPMVVVFVCYTGREDGQTLLAPLRAVKKPVADIVAPRPYVQMQSLIDGTQPPGRRDYWKSHYLPGVDERSFEVAMKQASRLPSPHSAILFFQLDGALSELPPDHSPVGNRDAKFVLNIATAWENAADDERNIGWARETFEATRAFSTGGAYLNFMTEDEGHDRTEAAYGKRTLERLAALKRKYDPENLFRHTRGLSG